MERLQSKDIAIRTEDIADIRNEVIDASYEVLEGLSGETTVMDGRVVGIVKRNWRQYAGSLDVATIDTVKSTDESKSSALDGEHFSSDVSSSANFSLVMFVPVDLKFPRIWIRTRRVEELKDCRLLCAIDDWPRNSLYPLGHYVRVLGVDGEKEVETQVLLHEFQVPHEAFTQEVMACLPPSDWKITEDLISQRTDLRHIPVVSIDPPGCKDIDDALHCIRLPNGRLQAGVHIAGKCVLLLVLSSLHCYRLARFILNRCDVFCSTRLCLGQRSCTSVILFISQKGDISSNFTD